jgi:hypothetical protein
MTSKRCTKCQLVKSATEFNKNNETLDRLSTYCRVCQKNYTANRTKRGLDILQDLATSRGCCSHCQKPYANEDWYFFEFDHIDPSLKRSKRETDSKWIASHLNEFVTRIAPNLQLLCVKCHKIKTSDEMQLGGVVYQKMFGESKPAQVLDPGWDLFNPVPLGEPDEIKMTYTRLAKEGEWITVRDINGKLISFEPYNNFIKTN